MDSERPHHRSGTTTSELFVCFTSRPSFSLSSSMKLSSKVPILSPGRTDKYRDHPTTLSFSSSLNRRLGSMKGDQASPMLKKRGSNGGGFENGEPSSPKVTCIGQVRVKTKKQGKKMMGLGNKEGGGGECRNQKWVHLPVTICEALRGFGAEFNCFLPCGKSCSSSKARGVKRRSMSSCGAAFARWLMALQEGEEEDKKRREIEIGEEDMIADEKKTVEGEEGRFSICIPPKNALLLMRCRSEPLRMSALANRFWDSPIDNEDDEDSSEDEESVEEVETKLEVEDEAECNEEHEEEQWDEAETVEDDQESSIEEEKPKPVGEQCDSAQAVVDEEHQVDSVALANEEEQWGLVELFEYEEEENSTLKQQEQWDSADIVEGEEEIVTNVSTSEEQEILGSNPGEVHRPEEATEEQIKTESNASSAVLPDCLLMMMCEPKLSMEVSKETWVCSTDFITHPSQDQVIKLDGIGEEVTMDKDTTNDIPVKQQKSHSTCMASVIEQKLMSAAAYEPYVLTRCKSEPMRSSSKLAPESCFWKNMQHEAPPSIGV